MSDNEWHDGIGVNRLWSTVSGLSIRNNEMWDRIILARRPLIAAALAWRDAAVADGWTMTPTYGEHESVDHAWSLEHTEGFKALGLSRPANCAPGAPQQRDDTAGTGQVSVWGPDGLALPSGRTYSMAALRAGLTTCGYCNATGVHTQRVGFAGRCCDTCLVDVRKMVETPGWTS